MDLWMSDTQAGVLMTTVRITTSAKVLRSGWQNPYQALAPGLWFSGRNIYIIFEIGVITTECSNDHHGIPWG